MRRTPKVEIFPPGTFHEDPPQIYAREPFTYADALLLLIGATALFELLTGLKFAFTAGLALFCGLARVKFLIAERFPQVPEWAFGVPSVVFWAVLYSLR